jgi:hypothetical protein
LALGAIQLAGMAFYANAPGERSVNRFSSIPVSGSTGAIAGTSELWYYYVAQNRPFHILKAEFPDSLLSHPEGFEEFDAVVLPANDKLLELPQLARRRKLSISSFTGTMVVCLKDGI